MDILSLLQSRYSVRDFKNTPVPKEALDKILEAGRAAPTAKNMQPQKIFVLESEEALAKVREVTPSAYNAPTVLMVCSDEDVAWKRSNDGWRASPIDTAIVTCHMMLEAESLGVNSVWVCAFNKEKLKNAFDLPENIVPYSLLPIGYKSDECEPNPRHFDRKDIEEIVKYL
ncbi:MAG: nitroreductase family protein [Clostridia bacterium]|nr:nitroreductase family protein [Clostridia bacterium]